MEKEALLKAFETTLRADQKAEATIDAYSSCVDRFLSFIGKPPADIMTDDIQHYKQELIHLRPATVNLHLAAVKSFLESHDNYGSDRVKRLTVRRKFPITLTQQEADRLLNAADGPTAHAVIAAFLDTGMRIGSLLKLEFRDILEQEGKVVLRDAKGQKTYVPLIGPRAIDAIQTYRRFRAEPRYTRDSDVVFINPHTREPYSDAGIRYMLKKAAVRAGITKRIYPHLLRHTHGTIARSEGLPLDSIRRQLGHASIQSTELYAQLTDEVYERDYDRFFQTSQGKQDVIPRRPVRKPDDDIAYR